MEWKEVASWLWALFLALFGLGYRAHNARIQRLEDRVDQATPIEEHRALQAKVREDIKDLHAKIEKQGTDHREAMDRGFREVRERLDKLLDRQQRDGG